MRFPLDKIQTVCWSLFFKVTLLFLVLASGPLMSQSSISCLPEKPTQFPYHVLDYTNTLSAQEIQDLEKNLNQFQNTTSNQIVVVLMDDLCGYSTIEIGTELIHRWGVGDEKKDNGIAIVIKPHGTSVERKVSIATGRGLEAVIMDGKAGEIERQKMIPFFKQNQFYQGILAGVEAVKPLASKEFHDKQVVAPSINWVKILFIIIIIIIVLIVKLKGARNYSRMNHIGLWEALWLTSFISNSRGGGGSSWGDFNSGGGGFGGFGGGDSGGGGAESGW